jgi:hypothetical protein
MTDSELEGQIKKALVARPLSSSRFLAVSIRAMGHHTTETLVGRTLKAMEIRGKVIRRASNGEGSTTWQLRQTPQQERHDD